MTEHSDKHEPCWHRANISPFLSVTRRWKEICCHCGNDRLVMEKRTEGGNAKHGKHVPIHSMFYIGE
jgi:hypothetical protein